jgi:cysteate synthase
LEAAPTVQRLIEHRRETILVVASAGNTGRAFAHACSITRQPLALVVPASALSKIWLPGDGVLHDSVFTISVDGDYSDAIALGDQLACHSGFAPEGGARNVARRDGMGTVMLEAALTINQTPDHYFQAVGSGTGGISAWEASMRLIKDGRFGLRMPVLNLAQNLPCAPIFSALHGVAVDPSCPEGMYDEVLFNRRPPLSVKGGVADALAATAGTIQGVTNDEAKEARRLFERTEGIDIMPAAAVAVSALMKSMKSGSVNTRDIVLLNITGGGEERLREDVGVTPLQSDLRVERSGADLDAIASLVARVLRKG